MDSARSDLLQLLRQDPRGSCNRQSDRIRALIAELERSQPADLSTPEDIEKLEGVWELRWSSSRQPYLAVGPWIENLQCLAPEQGRGMNLLRAPGPLGALAGIAVEASIAIQQGSRQRVEVRFQRGGLVAPLPWIRSVSQSFPAWLDITVLDDELRICRGNAGTLFALLRRPDLQIREILLR
jgi:hypothetical protein